MKTTRYIVQYQDTPTRWADTDSTLTKEEALAILSEKQAKRSTLTWRVVCRTTETTDEEIPNAEAA